MIFAKFLLFTKSRHLVQMEITGVRHKINLMLFARKLMILIALSHKDLPCYKDFLEEDKEW